MTPFRTLQTMISFLIVTITACSTVPKEIRQAAVDVPFKTLKKHTGRYTDQIVILGGYIERSQLTGDATRMVVLQAPLGRFDQPKSRKDSEGRFLVIHEGVLDPELYGIGQDITVSGRVLGRRVPEIDDYTTPIPVIKTGEIYRWRYGHDEEVEVVLEAAEPP